VALSIRTALSAPFKGVSSALLTTMLTALTLANCVPLTTPTASSVLPRTIAPNVSLRNTLRTDSAYIALTSMRTVYSAVITNAQSV
jgi:hypothetical protein